MSSKREPEPHKTTVDVATFEKVSRGHRCWLPWHGSTPHPDDIMLIAEHDAGEYTGRHHWVVILDVQKHNTEGERGIDKGCVVNFLVRRRPRTI